MTSKTEVSRYDVMDIWIRNETAVVRQMFDLACPVNGTMDRDEASRLRQEAFTRNAVLYRLVNTMADDDLLVAMGFDPADFDEIEDGATAVAYNITLTVPHDRTPGEAIDRVTDAIRAIRQGEVVPVNAGSDCCGKWAVYVPGDLVGCACEHPAPDKAAIDAFLDDHDALFGQRLAA